MLVLVLPSVSRFLERELMVRELPVIKCFLIDFVSASHGASRKTMLEHAAFSQNNPSKANSQFFGLRSTTCGPTGHQRREFSMLCMARISRERNRVVFAEAEEQPQEDAHSGSKWLCKAEMETRFGVRLMRGHG